MKSLINLRLAFLLAIALPLGLGMVACGDVAEVENSVETTETAPPPPPAEPPAAEGSGEADSAEDYAYTFVVTNETDDDLVGVQASEDEETWGDFDLGGQVIAPGESLTLYWDESTNDSYCEWSLRGIFADGSVVGPKVFDFCEEVEVVFYSEGEAETGGSADDFLNAEAMYVEAAGDSGVTLLAAEISDADKVSLAREFCGAMDDGYSVDEYIDQAASDEEFLALSAEEQDLVASYLGVAIVASADSYCPEYSETVSAWIDSE